MQLIRTLKWVLKNYLKIKFWITFNFYLCFVAEILLSSLSFLLQFFFPCLVFHLLFLFACCHHLLPLLYHFRCRHRLLQFLIGLSLIVIFFVSYFFIFFLSSSATTHFLSSSYPLPRSLSSNPPSLSLTQLIGTLKWVLKKLFKNKILDYF